MTRLFLILHLEQIPTALRERALLYVLALWSYVILYPVSILVIPMITPYVSLIIVYVFTSHALVFIPLLWLHMTINSRVRQASKSDFACCMFCGYAIPSGIEHYQCPECGHFIDRQTCSTKWKRAAEIFKTKVPPTP